MSIASVLESVDSSLKRKDLTFLEIHYLLSCCELHVKIDTTHVCTVKIKLLSAAC